MRLFAEACACRKILLLYPYGLRTSSTMSLSPASATNLASSSGSDTPGLRPMVASVALRRTTGAKWCGERGARWKPSEEAASAQSMRRSASLFPAFPRPFICFVCDLLISVGDASVSRKESNLAQRCTVTRKRPAKQPPQLKLRHERRRRLASACCHRAPPTRRV